MPRLLRTSFAFWKSPKQTRRRMSGVEPVRLTHGPVPGPLEVSWVRVSCASSRLNYRSRLWNPSLQQKNFLQQPKQSWRFIIDGLGLIILVNYPHRSPWINFMHGHFEVQNRLRYFMEDIFYTCVVFRCGFPSELTN